MGNTYLRAVELAKKEFGESSGGKYLEIESWFWNSEIQETVEWKKNAFKEWIDRRPTQRRLKPKRGITEKRIKVAKVAKEKGYEKLYGDLSENGSNTSTSLRKQGKKDL